MHSPREPQLLRAVREAAQRAQSLEEALRGALQRICEITGWQAGRVEFSQQAGELSSRIVWHLEHPERLPAMRRIAERRRRERGTGLADDVLRGGAPQSRAERDEGNAAVFAFERWQGVDGVRLVANLSAEPQALDAPPFGALQLKPWEYRVSFPSPPARPATTAH